MPHPLFARPHGLVVLAGTWTPETAAALWEELSAAAESVYFIGPLSEKPVLRGGASVWLLECPLEERVAGVGTVLRRDAHGIVLVGPAGAKELDMVVQAALVGSLCLVTAPAATLDEARSWLATSGVDKALLAEALVGYATPETVHVVDTAERSRLREA